MTVVKRIALTLLFLPLLFNAGFDVSRDWQARKTKSFVVENIKKIPGIATVKVHSCTDIKGNFWLCDVEVQTTSGETDRRLLPLPYEVLEAAKK